MVIQINQPIESDFSQPLGLLTDCHRRIERFLNVLLTISRGAKGNKLDSEQRQAFDLALRYFRDRAPLHTDDEEQSLFPRMREKRNSANEKDLTLLDQLHAEHSSASRCHDQMNELGRKWLDDGQLSYHEASTLLNLLEDLIEIYAEHISIEEQKVFPLAATLLDITDLDAIAVEMANRRGLVFSRHGAHT